ncbi:glycosyltransferase involved in cell wall biosynthesis [Methanohalophilus levihalophilus]|nr:glycosyltransferase involved in cell wall biosynthesis [Methanohalophilus levihalophilus]
MKICILGHYPSSGEPFAGVSRVVYSLSHELSELGVELFLLKKKRYSSIFRKLGCKKDKKITICQVSHIELIIDLVNNKYDSITIHNISFFFLIPLILKKLNLIACKIVFVSHGLIDLEKQEKRYDYPLRYSFYQKLFFFWSDQIVSVSNQLKENIVNYYSINPSKITVINNGVGGIFFNRSSAKLDALPDKYALYVGEIARVKGLDFLLDSMQRVELPIVLIGHSSSYLEVLKIKFSELFEKGKVIHLENLTEDELLAAYSNATFLALVSRHEPYGLVSLEAMASGKPVIVSDKVGAKEVIENGRDGFIVPFGDVESLVDSMNFILNNRLDARKIGLLAQDKAVQNTWSKKAILYLKMYEEIIV